MATQATPELLNLFWELCDKEAKMFEILGPRIPCLVCADGFSVSVQVGRANYCSPRGNVGPWTEAEIGFPSEEVPEWKQYQEDYERAMSDTVCVYVPLETICEVLNGHGGIVGLQRP